MTMDRKAARKWLRDVREVLNREWAPIPADVPDDEYESYAGKLAAMLRDKATDGELLDYLAWAEVEHIGLGPPFDRARGEQVVAALRRLGLPANSN